MKEAIKNGNKNISLTTIGLKRKIAKPQPQTARAQAEEVEYTEEADIKIWHKEENNMVNSEINAAIALANDLIRIANNSYFY